MGLIITLNSCIQCDMIFWQIWNVINHIYIYIYQHLIIYLFIIFISLHLTHSFIWLSKWVNISWCFFQSLPYFCLWFDWFLASFLLHLKNEKYKVIHILVYLLCLDIAMRSNGISGCLSGNSVGHFQVAI